MRFNPAIPPPSQHLSSRLSNKTKWHAKKQRGDQWTTQFMRGETKDLLMAGVLTDGQVNLNSFPTKYVNGLYKENGVSEDETPERKSPLTITLESINFFSGMLSNMNIDQISVQKMPEENCEDFTRSFLKVETKS